MKTRVTLRDLAEEAGYEWIRRAGNRAWVRDDHGAHLLSRQQLQAAADEEQAYHDMVEAPHA